MKPPNSNNLDEKKARELSNFTSEPECADKAPVQKAMPSELEWLAKVFEYSPLAMVVSRIEDGRIEQVNPAFLKLFGRSQDEVIGKTSLKLEMIAERDREEIIQTLEKGGSVQERETDISVSSGIRRAKLSIVRFEANGGPRLLTSIQDITEHKKAESQLNLEKKRLETILETIPTAVVIAEAPAGKFSYVNPRARELSGFDSTGLTLEENIARVKPRKLDGSPYPTDELPANQALKGRHVRNKEMIHDRPDGTSYAIYGSASPILGANGEPVAAAVVFEDITERRRSEEKLRESELRYREMYEEMRALFAAMTDLVFIFNSEGRYLKILDTSPPLLYKPSNNLLGKTLHEVFPKEQADFFLDHLMQALSIQRSVNLEYSLFIEDKEYWFNSTVSPISDEKILMVARDITERKKAEEAMRHSEERLRATLRSVADEIWIVDTQGHIVSISDSVIQNLGVSSDKWADVEAAIDQLEILRPDGSQRPRKDNILPRALGGEVIKNEGEMIRNLATGQLRWREVSGAPVRDAEGTIIGAVAVARDITERKHAEMALRESEQRLKLAIKAGQSGTFDWDAKTNTNHWSEDLLALYGMRPDEFGGRYEDWINCLLPQDREAGAAAVQRSLETGEFAIEFRIRRYDTGEVRCMHGRGQVYFDNDGQPDRMVGINVDITERKRAEEALHETEQRLRFALDAGGFGTFDYDLRTGKIHWDNQLKQIWGIPREENLDFADVLRRVHSDDQERVSKIFAAAIKPDANAHYEAEYRIVRPDGSIHWTSSRARIFFEGRGEERQAVRMIGIEQDITERKRAEQAMQQLNETLEQRVAERTELAEARAIQLQSLSVELIEAEERERRRIAQYLHDDMQQIIAAARFQLQAFQQGMHGEPTLMNIEKLLEESIRKSRRITHELSPPILEHSSLFSALKWLTRHLDEQFGLQVALKFSAAQLPESQHLKVFAFRAMQELLSNVHKHSGVKVAEVELSYKDDLLVLTVSDQGRGFNPESLDSAVAKDGFGLLSLRERVDYIGGNMLIESAQGQGSKFILSIPINSFQTEIPEGSTPNPNQAPRAESAPNRCIRILVADAHTVMRQGLIKLLSKQPDLEVVGEAANGREVIELARQIKPDVILLDTAMPDMGGIETTRLIRSELPNVYVIGLSMFPNEQNKDLMREAGAEAFISKSGSAAELLEVINGIFGRSPLR